jgi:hypothetical protein
MILRRFVIVSPLVVAEGVGRKEFRGLQGGRQCAISNEANAKTTGDSGLRRVTGRSASTAAAKPEHPRNA